MLDFLPTLERATRPNVIIGFVALVTASMTDHWMYATARARVEWRETTHLGKERFERAKQLELKLNDVIGFVKPDARPIVGIETKIAIMTANEDKAVVDAAENLRRVGALHAVAILVFVLVLLLIGNAWEYAADRFVEGFAKIYEPAREALYQNYLIDRSGQTVRLCLLRLRYRVHHLRLVVGCFIEMAKNLLRGLFGWDILNRLVYSQWGHGNDS